jgi:hypothetical protein
MQRDPAYALSGARSVATFAFIHGAGDVRLTAEAVLGSGSAGNGSSTSPDMLSGVAQNHEYMLVILQSSTGQVAPDSAREAVADYGQETSACDCWPPSSAEPGSTTRRRKSLCRSCRTGTRLARRDTDRSAQTRVTSAQRTMPRRPSARPTPIAKARARSSNCRSAGTGSPSRQPRRFGP